MLRVVVVGLGPIGIGAARAVLADPGMELVGLVDIDPSKVGKNVTELEGGPVVSKSLKEGAAGGADVAIVTTTSKLDRMAPTLREALALGLHVVSSCEEMAWPKYRHPELAGQLDAEAKRAGKALLGTGVNPGFVMDLLPVVLSSMVLTASRVRVLRQLDASTRRRPLQQKVGATMTREQFAGLKAKNEIGHQGLAESVAMIAAALGREAKGGSIEVTLDPVMAERDIPSAMGVIKPGQVCGMHNVGRWSDAALSIELDLTMAVGLNGSKDAVEIDGPVPLKLEIPGGTPGDTATVAALVNCARALPRARAGLLTMLDVGACGARAAG
ncbi:MAG: dihydrodipicolinate reductase [Phycisphaerales bacterium]|nr:dihydrodipicolinate reductase [Phycisphaerales bacterium]